ncbi:MAG: hypothetical protein HYV16_14390 [Gammaproteobacteria bacterium]|nr:hypothetical protein [Gammaproteobacteria bacterium]
MSRVLQHGPMHFRKAGGLSQRFKNSFGQGKLAHGLGMLSMFLGMSALPVTLLEPMLGGGMALSAMLLAGFAALQGELRYTMIAAAMATMELFWLSSELSLEESSNLMVLAIALPYLWSMVCLKLGLKRIQAREHYRHRSHIVM